MTDRITIHCQCGGYRAWVQRREQHSTVARVVCLTCGAVTLTTVANMIAPLPPEVLANALQDRVHPASGRLIRAKAVQP